MAAATYTAKDITVLDGLEPVRKRPSMYIGGVGSAGLHHLFWEILDNAVDEVMNGYARNICRSRRGSRRGSNLLLATSADGAHPVPKLCIGLHPARHSVTCPTHGPVAPRPKPSRDLLEFEVA